VARATNFRRTIMNEFPDTAQRQAAEQAAQIPDLDELEATLREPAPAETLDEMLAARNSRHGDFTDDARTAQSLKYVIHAGVNWDQLTQVQQEALDHIATKIARILSGDPRHRDHWSDIQGYARLVETRL
jgi:hypothetical protein